MEEHLTFHIPRELKPSLRRLRLNKKQVLIERKLISMLSSTEMGKKPFPNVNNLAVKTFVEKFISKSN